MSQIEFTSTVHSALAYHVLSYLDLGRDAASLFDPTKGETDWQSELRSSYLNAEGRLWLHFLPIQASDLEDLYARLEAAPRGLDDPQGVHLGRAFMRACQAELPAFQSHWDSDGESRRERLRDAAEQLAAPLGRLRTALWALNGGTPPPLTVSHCRDLRKAGRGVGVRKTRVVAVSLNESFEHALCQIFHEETHPVSDPSVSRQTGQRRGTHVDDPGYNHHMALEKAAVQLGRRIVRECAPEWEEGYERWAGRYGM
jgi:hypothetical protein